MQTALTSHRTKKGYNQYVLNKQDLQTPLNAEQHRFIEDMGQAMAAFGIGRTHGRMYAYMLLSPGPVSLDEIAADLMVAKSGVSLAARQLTAWGMARRLGQPGSRRVLYEAVLTGDAMVAIRIGPVQALFGAIRRGAEATPDPNVKRRLLDLADQFDALLEELVGAVQRAAARRNQ